ncbi:MAG: diacylglycerol kinase family lipid kinase [Bacteroidales bacterium]|nr:diacylglycerol kinase family lipid kinase [Bacteroidales bacterium]
MKQEESFKNQWLVIVNPNAGKRKGEKDWPEISALLTEAGFIFTHEFTTHRDHAIALTENYVRKGFRKIIAVGGDGTLNEVMNGIFRQDEINTTDVIVGMIMVGTGNDWGRMYNLKEKYTKAVEILKKQHLFIQDTGMVKYYDGPHEITRYFVNIAGLGYDALVTKMTNRTKEKGGGGMMSYLVNLLKGLFSYHHAYLEIEVDGESVYKGKVFSMSVGICKYNGGGMMQLPFAIPDDGLFDMTIFKNVSKMTVIKHIKKLYCGTFTNLPFVQTHRGKTVSIFSSTGDPSHLETDGESLGHSPFSFQIIPKSIRIITGKNWKVDSPEITASMRSPENPPEDV